MKEFTNDRPNFLTINQVAKTKLLSEYALRKLDKENRLPSIKVGNRTLINYNLLIKELNALDIREACL